MAGSVQKDGDSATGSRVGQEAEMRQTRLDTAGRAELQLTEEEKAVLMECRRNSTARGRCAWPIETVNLVIAAGLAATAGSILLLRALIASGEPLSSLSLSHSHSFSVCRQSTTPPPAMVFTLLHFSWSSEFPDRIEVLQTDLSGQDHVSGPLCAG